MSKKVFLFLLLINSAFISIGLTDDPQINFVLYQVSPIRFSPNGDGINDIAYFSLHAIVTINKVHGNAPIKWEIEVRKAQNNAEVWEEDGIVAMNPNGYTEFTIIIPWDGCKKDGNLLGSEHKPSPECKCKIAPDGNYTHKATIHYKEAKESQSGTLTIDNTDPDLLIISPANSTITNNQNIEITGRSSANITQIVIGNQIIYPSAGNWSAQISLSEGQNNIIVQGNTADGKIIIKELNIIKKAYFSAYIADFENGIPAIEPYHGLAGDRDTAPDISLSTTTYNRGSASIKLAATTWKTYHFTNQNISPIDLNATSELFFAIRVDTLAQMIGIGIGDGNKELIYAISGTKIMTESFISKNYQNSITNDSQWHFLKLPAGVDWNALWGNYSQIDRIFIIHDNTNIPISHTAYFDDIGILDYTVPPQVTGVKGQAATASNLLTWITSPQAPYVYKIYRRISSPPGGYQLIHDPLKYLVKHYFDNFNQPESTEYDYAIAACNNSMVCSCDPNYPNKTPCDSGARSEKLKPHIQYTYEGELDGNLSIYTTKKAFGDVNGNGFTDAIFLSQKPDKSFELKLSINSLGTLQDPVHLADTSSCVGESVIRDLDGDGFLDILYCYRDANTAEWRILPGNGDGTFKDAVSFPGDYYQAEISDIDRDGDLDIILGSYGKGIMLWTNNSYIDSQHITHWNFTSTQLTDAINYYVTNLKVIDINNDSYDDIVVAGFSLDINKNPIPINKILKNNKNNLFSESNWESNPQMLVTLMEVADFDGDGYPDIVIGIQAGDLKFYKNSTHEGFNSPVDAIKYSKTAGSKVNDYSSLASGDIGDIDNDGDLDIIIPGHWIQCYPPNDPLIPCYAIVPGGLILRNLGDGTFAFFDESAGTHHIYGSVLVDLNNDGDLDALLNLDVPASPISSRKTPQQNNSVLIYTNREADASAPNMPYGDNPNNKPAAPDISRMKIKFDAQDIEFDYNFTGSNPDDKTSNNDLFCNLYIGTIPKNQNITDDIYQAELDDILNRHNSLNNGSFPCGANHFLRVNKNAIMNKAGSYPTLYYSIQFVDQNQRRSLWASERSFFLALLPPTNVRGIAYYKNNGYELDYIRVSWDAPSSPPVPDGYLVYWGNSSRNYSSNSGPMIISGTSYDIPANQLTLSPCGIYLVYVAVTSVINTSNQYQESAYSKEYLVDDINNIQNPAKCAQIAGDIDGGNWGPNQCKLLTGNVKVKANNTLNILAGTCIYLNSGIHIETEPNANINIVGFSNRHVILRKTPSGNWDYILFNGSNNSHIQYAEIYGMQQIKIDGSHAFIDNSKIETSHSAPMINESGESSILSLTNNIIIDSSAQVSSEYIINLENGNLIMENNIIYHSATLSDNARGILWQGGKIISESQNNKLYKQVCTGSICTMKEDGIYLIFANPNINEDLHLKKLGNTCRINDCSAYIPYYIKSMSSLNIGNLNDDAYLIIDKGLEISVIGTSLSLGYASSDPFPYGPYNNFGGIKAIGSEANHIKIYLSLGANILFIVRNNSYNEINNVGSIMKYVDIYNIGSGNSGIQIEGKHAIYFDHCSFSGMNYILFSNAPWSAPKDILPQNFLPQGIFKYCNFDSFLCGYNGAIEAGVGSKIYIDYSTFTNTNGTIITTNSGAKIKIHHSNLDDSNWSFKIYPNGINVTIDARWNYWGDNDHRPEEIDGDSTSTLRVAPWFINPIQSDSFHIQEAHIDLLSFNPNLPTDNINISFKPSRYSANGQLLIKCYEDNIYDSGQQQINNGFGLVSLHSSDFSYCDDPNKYKIFINISAGASTSIMQAQIKPLTYNTNLIDMPIQSDYVSEAINISGTSSYYWQLYYNDLPGIPQGAPLASGSFSQPIDKDLDLSQYPKGEGYLVLKTLSSPGYYNVIQRVRHIEVGYGRPEVHLSKQQINVIPGANDSVDITISSEVAGTILLEIYNAKNGITYYRASGSIQLPNNVITLNWNGQSDSGDYAPDGYYRVRITFTPSIPPSYTYVYDPLYADLFSWRIFEYYPGSNPRIPRDDLGLIKLTYKAIRPELAKVEANVILPEPLPPITKMLYSGTPLYTSGSGILWQYVYSDRAIYTNPPWRSEEYKISIRTGLPENAIIAYGAAPRIKFATASSPVYRATAMRPWSRGFMFNVHFFETPQANQGVTVLIKPCLADVADTYLRKINQICTKDVCQIAWDGKDGGIQPVDYVEEGCYMAEFYGTDNRSGNNESLSPVPWRLYFDLKY